MMVELVFDGAINAFHEVVCVRYSQFWMPLKGEEVWIVVSDATNGTSGLFMAIFQLTGFWIPSAFFKPIFVLREPIIECRRKLLFAEMFK